MKRNNKKNKNLLQIEISFPEELRERLFRLMKDSGSETVHDLLVKAFATYEIIIAHKNSGGNILLDNGYGDMERLEL